MTTPQQGGARNRRRCDGDPGAGDPDGVDDVDIDRVLESDAFWADLIDDDGDSDDAIDGDE